MPSEIFLPFITVKPHYRSEADLSAELLTYWMNEPRQLRPQMRADQCLVDYAKSKAYDIANHNLPSGHVDSQGRNTNQAVREFGCPIPDWYPNDMNCLESLGYNYPDLPRLFDAFWQSRHHQAHVFATDVFWKPHVRMGCWNYVNTDLQQGEWIRLWVLVSAPEESESP